MHNVQRHLKHYKILDTIRGLAALWVFIAHSFLPAGILRHIPILTDGRAAVDIFMALSGFLIFDRYSKNKNFASWGRYFVARVFRICPLYYALLVAAAIFLLPSGTAITQWLAYRFSFFFGFCPSLLDPAPLPDWSLALELQFYIAFPFLIFLGARIGWITLILASSTLSIIFYALFSVYPVNPPALFGNFSQPTILFSKLSMFFLGSIIALGRTLPVKQRVLLHSINLIGVLTPALLLAGYKSSIFVYFFAICFYYIPLALKLHTHPFFRRFIDAITNKTLCFFGAISYALYLFHPFIFHWMESLLFTKLELTHLAEAPRYFLFLIISTAIVVPCSYLLHIWIELPGIAWGKSIANKLFPKAV